MDDSIAGFREVAHAADWQLEIWAPDIPGLMEQAARGMYALAGVKLKEESRQERTLILHGIDLESLLVSFLSELLYLSESAGLGFDQFRIDYQDETLTARLFGAQVAQLDKEIKAVTYHNLHIRMASGRLRASIVFDV